MKLLSIFSVLSLVLLIGCNNSPSETLIAKNQLGLLTPDTHVDDLKDIFKNDSVGEFKTTPKFNRSREIEIFNEEGKISLVIEPDYKKDSIVTINEIQILDPKYKTKKGLSIDSDFKFIYENYKIDNIQNSINSVILSLHEIGAYVVIDKKHLSSKLRFDAEAKIEANQIFDDAPIRYFSLRFEK